MYLRNPGRAVRDFKLARWKVGFLKRLLPLPLPYGRLYAAVKRNDKGQRKIVRGYTDQYRYTDI